MPNPFNLIIYYKFIAFVEELSWALGYFQSDPSSCRLTFPRLIQPIKTSWVG